MSGGGSTDKNFSAYFFQAPSLIFFREYLLIFFFSSNLKFLYHSLSVSKLLFSISKGFVFVLFYFFVVFFYSVILCCKCLTATYTFC